jgi:hypothetical protein
MIESVLKRRASRFDNLALLCGIGRLRSDKQARNPGIVTCEFNRKLAFRA